MSPTQTNGQKEWAVTWLKSVQAGQSTMSQRKLTSIEKHAGSLDLVKRAAEELGVHLLLVEDEDGDQIVAASRKPFKVIC